MAPIDRISDRPAYQQIADELRSKIETGALAEGAKLPSERELSETYGTARVTVRQAIAVLRSEGLVAAEHGRGIFVKRRRPVIRTAPSRLSRSARDANQSAFIGDATNAGYTWRVETDIEITAAGQPAGDLFGIEPDDDVLTRDRTMYVDDEPVQLAISTYNYAIVKGTALEQKDTGPGGAHARLADLGRAPVRFTEILKATMPTPGVARLLRLGEGSPIIKIERLAYDQADRVVEITHMTLAADRYVLRYDFEG
ncbi:GntR family transcriptional regulator [Frankia sp. R43]|uniref:GntR family transcriptional regulator n=1 Tax=Frankia sp. R43 TaxID=269536 RepID=UPI0006CA408F|nr:GntR family transcriptional regulator [Frankia sp. R43]KPM53348.1 GntR family transcriptional regulator [Frankia sp. R43]